MINLTTKVVQAILLHRRVEEDHVANPRSRENLANPLMRYYDAFFRSAVNAVLSSNPAQSIGALTARISMPEHSEAEVRGDETEKKRKLKSEYHAQWIKSQEVLFAYADKNPFDLRELSPPLILNRVPGLKDHISNANSLSAFLRVYRRKPDERVIYNRGSDSYSILPQITGNTVVAAVEKLFVNGYKDFLANDVSQVLGYGVNKQIPVGLLLDSMVRENTLSSRAVSQQPENSPAVFYSKHV